MIDTIFGCVIIVFLSYASYASCVMNHKRKKAWKAGKTDYYGNPIKKGPADPNTNWNINEGV